MTRASLSAALIAVCSAGCLHFESKPLNPAKSAARLTDRKLAAKTWTLKALTDEAVRTHPDVALAKAQYATAAATIRTAGERPNPTLNLAPQIVTPLDWIAGTYGVDIDWTIETAGKRSRRIDVAHQQARAAAFRVVDATWKVRAAVRKAMLELFAAEKRTTLLANADRKSTRLNSSHRT